MKKTLSVLIPFLALIIVILMPAAYAVASDVPMSTTQSSDADATKPDASPQTEGDDRVTSASRFAPGMEESALYFTDGNGNIISQIGPNTACFQHVRVRYNGANATRVAIWIPSNSSNNYLSSDDKFPLFTTAITDGNNGFTAIWSNFCSATGYALDYSYDTGNVIAYLNGNEYENGVDWLNLTNSSLGYVVEAVQPRDEIELVIPLSIYSRHVFLTGGLDETQESGVLNVDSRPNPDLVVSPTDSMTACLFMIGRWIVAAALLTAIIYIKRNDIKNFFTYISRYNKS